MQALAEALPRTFLAFAFAFGAVVGSFLNVVIARVPAGLSIVKPGSRCPRCGMDIAWYDNIPIVSWILLRARCRGCALPISARYPAVELLAGVLALSVVKHFGATPVALGYFAFAAMLVALAYIDLDTWLLPHEITWPLVATGLASPLWHRALPFRSSIAGALCGFAVFSAITLFGEKVLKRELMGWGDAWLLAGICAWLGLGALLPVVLLASFQGALIGGLLLALQGRRSEVPPPGGQPHGAGEGDVAVVGDPAGDGWTPPTHAVPFGPFLALAALEQLLLGDALTALWMQLIGLAA
ncbi:MAG TPA: prepilin peptidase [Myxococcales bacterium]|jgi:leader peptidase (prepilin peptidase) / N-methyltransferase|nr:prepilin peptidase [Myxococcales bacterium]